MCIAKVEVEKLIRSLFDDAVKEVEDYFRENPPVPSGLLNPDQQVELLQAFWRYDFLSSAISAGLYDLGLLGRILVDDGRFVDILGRRGYAYRMITGELTRNCPDLSFAQHLAAVEAHVRQLTTPKFCFFGLSTLCEILATQILRELGVCMERLNGSRFAFFEAELFYPDEFLKVFLLWAKSQDLTDDDVLDELEQQVRWICTTAVTLVQEIFEGVEEEE